jgi:outer membrane protein OmpA-like peptidoglycan-associated protein
VVEAVAGLGVEAARMSAVGWGQDKPVADNTTEEGRAKNRRVEVVKK